MSPVNFIKQLTNQIFMMLPWSDSVEIAEEMHLKEFIDSMVVQISGSRLTFGELTNNTDYIEVENIIRYVNANDIPLSSFKREIRKALRLLNAIEKELVKTNVC